MAYGRVAAFVIVLVLERWGCVLFGDEVRSFAQDRDEFICKGAKQRARSRTTTITITIIRASWILDSSS
jgi:hypothetical protein